MKSCTATVSNRIGTWTLELSDDGTGRVLSFERAEPMRGLGDVVAAVTTAVGIKPCGGCKQRQAFLNRVVPFGNAEGSPAPTDSTSASADGATPPTA